MNTNIKDMQKTKIRIAIWLVMSFLTVFFLSSCGKKAEPLNNISIKKTTIRIGWQTAWATQGQLALILKNTDVLGLVGLQGDFKSFTYGAPLSEAALAGQLDVAFVGDQPAINLLSRSKDWRIVGRLMDFRVALVVPMDSDLKTVADLKGKTIGIPFGASTHRFALEALNEAGLEPAKDVTLLNIDIVEQGDIIRSSGGKRWPGIDAFASWDHHIALYEQQKLARILKTDRALGVVMMSQRYIRDYPQEAAEFLAAFNMAYYYYASHRNEADGWFAAAMGGHLDGSLLRKVAEIEPNLRATSIQQIDTSMAGEHLVLLQRAADFAYANALIKSALSIDEVVVTNLWTRARAFIDSKSLLRSIQVQSNALTNQ